MITITHAEAQALISERLDNPLDTYIDDVLNGHLASCEQCRAFADSSTRLASSLRAMPFLPASPVVRQNVWAAIESQSTWQQRLSGALTGQTAAIVSTAAIALIVIAFSAVAIMRLVDDNGDGDQDTRLAAGTRESLALATETAETSELTFATEAAPVSTTTPEPEPTTEAVAPTDEPPTQTPATATEAPTEEPAPTETPPEDTDLAMAETAVSAPTDAPTEAAEPDDDAPTNLTGITGDEFPNSDAPTEEVEEESAGISPASLIATSLPPTPAPAPTEASPTETPVPATATPLPTESPVPATETPAPTETPVPAPTDPPVEDTPSPPDERDDEESSPLIVPVDGIPVEADDDSGAPSEPDSGVGGQASDDGDSDTAQTSEALETEADVESGDGTAPVIGPPGGDNDEDSGPGGDSGPRTRPSDDDDDQIIVPIDDDSSDPPVIDGDSGPTAIDDDDDVQDIVGALAPEGDSTPAIDDVDQDGEQADIEPGSFDLSNSPVYSDGTISGSPDERLGFTDDPIFGPNPDGVSLFRDDLDVQPVSDGESEALAICAGGDCVEATSSSDDVAFIDESIGWVDSTLIYQRTTADQAVELRAVEWNGAPVSDEGIGSLDGNVTALGSAYPVNIGTLVPTDSAWLLVEGGSVQVIDGNPYGDVQLVRTNHADGLITYVAGSELIVASTSSPGTAINSIPFNGVDYDLSPDTSTVAISTGSGIELWSRDGAFIGASDSSIDTGSVVWRSTGIIFIDQSNDLLRLLDPAALQP